MGLIWKLRVLANDRAGEAWLDRIEGAAHGSIESHRDDGCGMMVLMLRPHTQPTGPRRSEILKAVQDITSEARWVQV